MRVLNIYTSVPTRTGFRHLEPGEPWTAELGELVTAPDAWLESGGAEVEAEDATVEADAVADGADADADADAIEDAGDTSEDASEAPDAEAVARYKGMKKPELQAALEERGLDSSGTVAELLTRLVADDAATR